MVRLCPTPILACMIALVCLGCTGQTLEGRWKGALPYPDATDCRIKMFSDGRFSVVCRDDAWVGTGRYSHTGEKLRFDYDLLTRKGKAVRVAEPLDFYFVGHGNKMDLECNAEKFTWSRILGD